MKCDKQNMLLYAVTDRAWVGKQTLYEQVESALKGGVTCVQLREKELDDEAFLKEAVEIHALCQRYGVPFFVNDNVDIAIRCHAEGVHVGQEDMAAAQVRARVANSKMGDVMDEGVKRKQRHDNMSHIRGKDTSIEIKLRKALWEKGYRYRKNYKKLPGSPDIAITKYKLAIFCDSEFFHGKDWDILKPRLSRGSNPDFWIKKIERNKQRDDENDKKLLFLGWTVIHFWGKDILKRTDECVRVIEETIFDMKISE